MSVCNSYFMQFYASRIANARVGAPQQLQDFNWDRQNFLSAAITAIKDVTCISLASTLIKLTTEPEEIFKTCGKSCLKTK